MKRWILKSGASDLDGLVLEETAIPEPGPGEVRVRVRAASMNYRDQLTLANAGGIWRTDRDLIPVADGAGEIDAVGEGVSKWSVGDRIVTVYLRDFISWPPHNNMGQGLGSLDEDGVLAEYIVLPAERVTRAPKSLTLAEAATLPCAALTAWMSIQTAAPVREGDKVLTLGTGSVSLFALAFSRALGATVYATTSKDEKASRVRELGAAETFNYRTDTEWGKSVYTATGGVQKVVNTAGFGSINQSVDALAYGGDIAMVGLFDFGDAIDPTLFLEKGTNLRAIPTGHRDGLDEAIRFIDEHNIKPVIDRVIPFAEAKDAFEALGDGDLFGKIIIEFS